jgi:hypothetical protein
LLDSRGWLAERTDSDIDIHSRCLGVLADALDRRGAVWDVESALPDLR